MTDAEKKKLVEDCYRKEYNSFIRAAMRLLKNKEDAEDCVQEAMSRAVIFLDKLKDDGVRPWLYRIILNTALNDMGKKYARRRYPVGGLIYNDYDFGSENGCFYEESFSDEIVVPLNELDGIFRDVILFAHESNMTYEEIAKAINRPVGTVMSSLFRARKKLKNKLKQKNVKY